MAARHAPPNFRGTTDGRTARDGGASLHERDFASICLVAERDTADATPRAARDGGRTARTTRGGRARDRARRDRPTVGSRCHFCFVHTLLFCLYCGTRLTSAKHGGKKLVKDGCTYARAYGLVGIVRTGGMRQLGGYLGQCEAYDLFRWAGGLEFDVGGRSGRLELARTQSDGSLVAQCIDFSLGLHLASDTQPAGRTLSSARKRRRTVGGYQAGIISNILRRWSAHTALRGSRLQIPRAGGPFVSGQGTQRCKHRDGFVTASRRTRGDAGRAVACPCSA